MNREHAKLSASGAARWLVCPKSVALEAILPEETSIYAEEGRLAHDLAEYELKRVLGIKAKKPKGKNYTQEMKLHAEEYAKHCKETYNDIKKQDPKAYPVVEEKMKFDSIVPEGFGTTDFAIISNLGLHIIDYKFGKGVPVDARNNSQTRLYALAAYQEYGWIFEIGKEVTTQVFQPRLNSLSTEIIALEDLLKWSEKIKVLAEKAYHDQGEYHPGEHCRFCRAKALCRARTDYILQILKGE